jgi:hypothetical protein
VSKLWLALQEVWLGWWLIAAGSTALVAYFLVIKHYMKLTAQVLGKDLLLCAAPWWHWTQVKLFGWKTIILAWVAVGAQALSLMAPYLPMIGGLPWSGVFSPRTADMITIVCTLLIPLTHAHGLYRAAQASPIPPEEQH